MKIGLISDTHSHLEDGVFYHFKNCDEIWHAGDIGNVETLEKLEAFKPVRAVWGNIDGHKIREATPENQFLDIEGRRILITHIAGKPPSYTARVKVMIARYRPHILICGHSHILKVAYDDKNNLLFINPGAAGIQGFHKMKTLLRFEIENARIFNMEVVELGPRGTLVK
ncbi:MAG: metallophosphoesterase family protein [Cyclobacteriaceae bacterium]